MTDPRNELMRDTINTFRTSLLAESITEKARATGFNVPIVYEGCSKKMEEGAEEPLDEMSGMSGGGVEGAMGGGAPADPEKPDYAKNARGENWADGLKGGRAFTEEELRAAARRGGIAEELDFADGDKTSRLEPLLPVLQKVNPKLKAVTQLKNAIEGGNLTVMNATVNNAIDELEAFAASNLDNNWAVA